MLQGCAYVAEGMAPREVALGRVADRLRATRAESSGYAFASALADLWLERGLEQTIPRREVLFKLGKPADVPSSEYARREQVERAWHTAVATADLSDDVERIPAIEARTIARAQHWILRWSDRESRPHQDVAVRYKSEPGARKLPWHVKLVWRRDEYNLNTLYGRLGFLFPIVPIGIALIILGPFLGLAFFAFSRSPTAENVVSLLSISLACGLLYIFGLQPINSLFRYRSLLLGDFSTDQIVIDLQKRSEEDRFARVLSVSGNCIVCGSDVSLDSGWREFNRPIVGRCRQSPMEHVFTFDRATMEGEPLRRGCLRSNR